MTEPIETQVKAMYQQRLDILSAIRGVEFEMETKRHTLDALRGQLAHLDRQIADATSPQ